MKPVKYDSKMVRVKLEVEELVARVAELAGYHNYSIRNYAILLGLAEILEQLRVYGRVVIDDEAVERAISNVKLLLEGLRLA